MSSFFCITGATGGLGKAFAVECASRGWDLFLTDRPGSDLTSLVHALSATYGVKVDYFPCDLTKSESRQIFFEHIRSGGHRFRGLINVAGVDYEGLFAEKTRAEISTIVRLNIEAALEVTHAILELREDSYPFRLINVASLASFYPMPVKATYAASKRFLLDFSRALREEIRETGGSVTVLCPAGLPTTESAIRAISAQGFMGKITTKDIGYVAARTIDYALKGRLIYIPGIVNRLLRFLGAFIPATAVSRLINYRWKAAHRKKNLM